MMTFRNVTHHSGHRESTEDEGDQTTHGKVSKQVAFIKSMPSAHITIMSKHVCKMQKQTMKYKRKRHYNNNT